ncbi:catalase family peroxidase [Paraburkholderia sp. SIMBA_049]
MAEKVVNLFESGAGHHPGFRRNHAKGVCVGGHFEGNGRGAALSHASVLTTGSVPVVGRFSFPGGNPLSEDGNAQVRSFALAFSLHGGEVWHMAMNSAPMFIVATPQAVVEQLDALRPNPATGKSDPARIQAFLNRHPETGALREWVRTHAPASGFDNATYYSINAFRFIDAQNRIHYVRWRLEPEQPYQPMQQSNARDPDFLAHDLHRRLEAGSVRWHLILTEARSDDPVHDATRAWLDDRARLNIDAGTLVIDDMQTQIDGPCRDVNFDPLMLPSGIAPSDDPLLTARSAVYAESFRRRTGEAASELLRSPRAQATGDLTANPCVESATSTGTLLQSQLGWAR